MVQCGIVGDGHIKLARCNSLIVHQSKQESSVGQKNTQHGQVQPPEIHRNSAHLINMMFCQELHFCCDRMTWKVLKSSGFSKLPSCIYPLALKTTCGVIELAQHQFRQWLVARRHQAIAWTNVDLSVTEPCGIQVRTLSHEMVQEISISAMYWKIKKLQPHSVGLMG